MILYDGNLNGKTFLTVINTSALLGSPMFGPKIPWLHGSDHGSMGCLRSGSALTGARMLKWVKCRRLSTTSCPNSPSRSAIWTLGDGAVGRVGQKGSGRDRCDRCGPEMSRVSLDPPKWMV